MVQLDAWDSISVGEWINKKDQRLKCYHRLHCVDENKIVELIDAAVFVVSDLVSL